MQNKGFADWIWLLITLSFILTIVNINFAIVGFILILLPMYQSIKLKRQIYCVTASSNKKEPLKNLLQDINLDIVIPKKLQSESLKFAILSFMIYAFCVTVYYTFTSFGNLFFAALRFSLSMLLVYILLSPNNKEYLTEQIEKK